MAHAPDNSPLPTVTAEGFLADRMAFWGRFTGFTAKTTGALIYFCAWLWWASANGYTLLDIVALPVGVAILFVVL